MRLSWKLLAALAVAALTQVGCGGINASQSVSPASFFLPGLLQNTPASSTNSVATAAQPPANLASVP